MTNVVFRALPPDEFTVSRQRGDLKSVWTVCADPFSGAESEARILTRASIADPKTRGKFRRSWSFFSTAIVLIRLSSLGLVRKEDQLRFSQEGTAALAHLGNTQDQKVSHCHR